MRGIRSTRQNCLTSTVCRLSQVELIIGQAKADIEKEAAEKRKTDLMNEYDDLSSEGWSIWDKHLKRFISWDGLFAAAQSNWVALQDSHDYSPADDSEESLKLQIAIWNNFKADLEYAVRAIKKEGAERGNIWLLNLLAIDVDPKPTIEPAEFSDEQTRGWAMEEAEFSYAEIEDEIAHLNEEEQIEFRQFLKVNYDAYGTYGWRDKLKTDALERLAEL